MSINLTFEVRMQLFAAESEYLQADHSQCGSVLKVRKVSLCSPPIDSSIAACCTHVKHCSSPYRWHEGYCNAFAREWLAANKLTDKIAYMPLSAGL